MVSANVYKTAIAYDLALIVAYVAAGIPSIEALYTTLAPDVFVVPVKPLVMP
jgi:hypothetical protein